MLFAALAVACSNRGEQGSTATMPDSCPLSQPAGDKLALVVGIGRYRSRKVPSLAAPVNDAKAFYRLLTTATTKGGYGFATRDVCLLLDEQADTRAFNHAFKEGLIRRAKKSSAVVIYFAGHGSIVADKNRDEPDEWDETLLLYDSRHGGTPDLIDDEFNILLAQLHRVTANISVFLDASNGGGGTRGRTGSTRSVAAVSQPPRNPVVSGDGGGDGGGGYVPEELPGLVLFAAAKQGHAALEKEGRGVFTTALIEVLSQARSVPTYAQVARQVSALVAAHSNQTPYYQGRLDRLVFDVKMRPLPAAWEVKRIAGSRIDIIGAPLPGMGVGAELRLYEGNISTARFGDPAYSKGRLVVKTATAVNATAGFVARGGEKAAVGDLAVLVRPADGFIKITLGFSQGADSLGTAQRGELQALIDADARIKNLVTVIPGHEDFILGKNQRNGYELRGGEGRVRNRFEDFSQLRAKLTTVLWKHAKQRAILSLRGEGGADFQNHHSLQVRIIPAQRQPKCAKRVWDQAAANQKQIIPLCHHWRIQVSAHPSVKKPLLVGGMIFSNDGDIIGFPTGGARQQLLHGGETHTFAIVMQAKPPIGVLEHVIVFGTQASNPVPWYQLTEVADANRSAAGSAGSGGLQGALRRYMRPGERVASLSRAAGREEDSTWTMTGVPIQVEANAQFWAPKSARIAGREYTLPTFDNTPYLPSDKSTALYKVLTLLHQLANASKSDGYGYKQHDWSLSSDALNLKKGIDCSRTVWYTFTRAGLQYNRSNRYLSTAMMVQKNTWMNDEFDRCDDDPNLLTGDVLVYRDAKKGDGHTVFVVDAEKRIAIGSHGWDGTAKMSNYKIKPDTGVEYQKIKYKKDWQRWDRTTMARVACWRYRKFTQERNSNKVQPVSLLQSSPCSEENCPIR